MNKTQKVLIALLGVAVLFTGFVMFRVTIAKPASVINVAKIPKEQYHDLETWGKFYPLQYQSYKKMEGMAPSPTGYGGSELVQKSDMQPELKMLFKGYPFSIDYSEDRGHVYTLHDVAETKRVGPATKGACITCKTSYMDEITKEMGWDYASKPFAEILSKTKAANAGLDCMTCHDPDTMNLRVVNPAFIDAMNRRGIDVTKASKNDMRMYVCAQCHVEYYFQPGSMKVTFPWDKGLTPQEMYVYYKDDPNGFKQDWVHTDSKTAMLKAQHPDYETFSSSSHARSGVTCSDCHLPFTREDGQKYSSHWMTSPLKTLDTSCSPCHNQGKEWLMERVKSTQDKTFTMQHTAGQTIARAHEAIAKAANTGNVNEAELAKARELVREAQFYWDMVAAESSMGFHNPQQVMSTLGQANELGHQAIEAANKAANIQLF